MTLTVDKMWQSLFLSYSGRGFVWQWAFSKEPSISMTLKLTQGVGPWILVSPQRVSATLLVYVMSEARAFRGLRCIRHWPKPWASDTDLSHGRGSCRQRGTCWTPCWNSSSCPRGILHSKQMQRCHFNNIQQHKIWNYIQHMHHPLQLHSGPLRKSSLLAHSNKCRATFLSSVGVFFKCGRFLCILYIVIMFTTWRRLVNHHKWS